MGVNDSMKSSFGKKSLVFAIIVLFFGISIMPATGSIFTEESFEPTFYRDGYTTPPSSSTDTMMKYHERLLDSHILGYENTFFPNDLSCYPLLNQRSKVSKVLKKVSIEAEDVGMIISNLGSNIGPLWLSKNPVQFTIYEGETEIKLNGETQTISDFPVHVFLFNFYGFGPTIFLRQSTSIATIN